MDNGLTLDERNALLDQAWIEMIEFVAAKMAEEDTHREEAEQATARGDSSAPNGDVARPRDGGDN